VIRRAFACFADPRVLEACSPPARGAFNVDAYLHEVGTLYLVGSKGAQATVAPLLTALIEDLVEEAKRRAFLAPGGRLDPWLALLLDEPFNTAAPDSVPGLMSEGGGSGIATTISPQNRWQLLAKWGERGGRALAAAANVQVFLGGLTDAERLRDLQTLSGVVDEVSTTRSTQADSLNLSEQVHRHDLISVADIRTLPEGRALVYAANLPPAEVQVPAWWERPDAGRLRQAQRDWVQRLARGEHRS
jgi:type IV secretory pathway TraG/TraD family ATPase VirD4